MHRRIKIFQASIVLGLVPLLFGCSTVTAFATPGTCQKIQSLVEAAPVLIEECGDDCADRVAVYAPLGGAICAITVHEVAKANEGEVTE
ncbi:MAG: hypothetical protein ACPGWS_09260 [Solirubrobacterales bacterium]